MLLTVVVIVSAAAVVAIFYVWRNWKDLKDLPGIPWILVRFPADRLTIAVTHLDNDKDREHEKLLLDELRHFECVETVGADRIVDSKRQDKKKSEEEARGLLKKTGADILIWGSVVSLSGKSYMRLYWTPSRDLSSAKANEKYLPQTETIALPELFWSDLKQILGLLTQTRWPSSPSISPAIMSLLGSRP